MPTSWFRAALAPGLARLLLVALGWTLAAAASPGATPELQFEAPPALAPQVEQLQGLPAARWEPLLDLVGLETAGAPIHVLLADEESRAARNTPHWISGYAYSALSRVVLFPERETSYPDSSLDELLLHEVAHVLIHRAAGSREVPRWFNEGVAMLASGQWGIEDRSRLTLALVFARRPSVGTLDALFAGGSGQVHRAYALSGALVRELHRFAGPLVAARILRRISVGLEFDEAFLRSTGLSLAQFEERFWQRHSVWYRWLPVATSSLTLWLGIAALALWAAKRRRQRRQELERIWELEEEWERARTHDQEPVN